jgi:hypothetical protein
MKDIVSTATGAMWREVESVAAAYRVGQVTGTAFGVLFARERSSPKNRYFALGPDFRVIGYVPRTPPPYQGRPGSGAPLFLMQGYRNPFTEYAQEIAELSAAIGADISPAHWPAGRNSQDLSPRWLAEFEALEAVLCDSFRLIDREAMVTRTIAVRAEALLRLLKSEIQHGHRAIDLTSPRPGVSPDDEVDDTIQTSATGMIFNAIELVNRYGIQVRHNLEPEFREFHTQILLVSRLRALQSRLAEVPDSVLLSSESPLKLEQVRQVFSSLLRGTEAGQVVIHLPVSPRLPEHVSAHGTWASAIVSRILRQAVGLLDAYNIEVRWSDARVVEPQCDIPPADELTPSF